MRPYCFLAVVVRLASYGTLVEPCLRLRVQAAAG